MKELIRKLVEAPAPSGYEGQVRKVIREEIESLADEIRVDNLGNLIARKGRIAEGNTAQGKRIMLVAHMDEIGIIATHIDEVGYVRFLPIGGVNQRYCPGGRVRFLNGAAGVIGVEGKEWSNNAPRFENMYIDLGSSSRDEVPVRVGDVAVFERTFRELGNRLLAKALDDRAGVAVLIEVMRQLENTPNEIYFVFSTQEEVGVRGATTSAYAIEPEIGVAVDVTGSGDTPHGSKIEVALGKGPAIKVRDQSVLSDPRIVRWMEATARQAEIPYQIEVLELGGTDTKAIQLSRAGVPAGCLSIPARYVHSPSEMVDLGDVQAAVKLLVNLLGQPVDLGDL